ncbi:MAG TPA: hypothetical protein VD905_16930 [Flavobacteriales bacterium]|nr:hypothetical protein [Flavobacteriales bacterium]
MLKKITLLVHSLLAVLFCFANKREDIGRGVWKESTATVTKIVPNKTKPNNVVLIVNVKCPGDACAKKGLKMAMNGIEVDVKPDKNKNFVHVFKPGKFKLKFSGPSYFAAYTDSINFEKGTKVFITVQFELEQKNLHTRKPVIYLYPHEKTEVNVQLVYNGDLEFTYPEYTAGGWDVTANPNGTIEADGKQYNYLFWDGKMDQNKLNVDFSSGFVVDSKSLVTFLESTLAQIGFNSKESADFITYWVPLMQVNEKNYIHFILNEDYNQVATINVSPEPNCMLRVFMVWTKASGGLGDVLPQAFVPCKREGFTLIEWGGSEYTLQVK